MFARLQSNRNKIARKPATVAKLAGHGSRTGANGASLRGLRGGVRAGEDGDKGKREEMNHPLPNSKPKSARR
tara:strand:+ start:122 stop:337 length:216 start_codon:yes stop_codon:yes gene_type:complete